VIENVDNLETEHQVSRPHGNYVARVAFDPTGKFIVTGDTNGVVRVGPITDEEPHLLLGHEGLIQTVAVSPDGRWVVSGYNDNTTRLWPMPNLDQQPFYTLPYEKFLDRLRALTNLRAVPDEISSTGYTLKPGPFPGWKTVPTW
jgi:WD40 repeat protein